MLRLHLDENVDVAVAAGLRARGVDVTTAEQSGLLAAPDAEHIQFGVDRARVIVTHDSDFLAFAAAGVAHAGIAFCRQQSRTVGELIARLELLAHCCSAADMANRIEFL